MTKSTYLKVLFFINLGFFHSNIVNINIIIFLVSVLWFIFGWIYFTKKQNNYLNNFKNRKYVYILLIIYFISAFSPLAYYNQPFFETLISQRVNFYILFLLLFLRMCPSEEDIFNAVKTCIYLAVPLYFISIFFPEFFLSSTEIYNLQTSQYYGSMDLIRYNPAAAFLVFYITYLSNKFYKEPTIKLNLEFYSLCVVLVLLQNRSRLVFLLLIVLFIIYKTRNRYTIPIILTTLIILSNDYFSNILNSLYTETIVNANDTSYSRTMSLQYFLIDQDFSIFKFLFGNGFPSITSDYFTFLNDLRLKSSIIVSDVGLIGGYFLYGISFILFLLNFIIKAFKRKIPAYLKLFALFILIVPTIHSFGLQNFQQELLFVTFFYLVIYFSNSSKKQWA